MFSTFLKFVLTSFLIGVASVCVVSAQIDASTPNGKPKEEDFPKGIKETLVKQRIEQEKKEHQELLKRGDEALQLSTDLEKSFADNNTLTLEDQKKLERLEKIVKKIRKELGGDDDNDGDEKVFEKDSVLKNPSTAQSAFKVLQESTVKLVNELKKSTRHTISVIAIQSSNLLLKAVRFLRFTK
jgi:hypothetical protein